MSRTTCSPSTGTGPVENSMPRAVALERSRCLYRGFALVIRGSAGARGRLASCGAAAPSGVTPCGTATPPVGRAPEAVAMGSGSGFPRLVSPRGTPW